MCGWGGSKRNEREYGVGCVGSNGIKGGWVVRMFAVGRDRKNERVENVGGGSNKKKESIGKCFGRVKTE